MWWPKCRVLAVVGGPLPQGTCVAGSGWRWFGSQFGHPARGLDVPRAGSRGLFSPCGSAAAFACLLRPSPQYTLNGKKVEVAVKQIIAGKAVEHRGAFSNPETLDLYRDIPELHGF